MQNNRGFSLIEVMITVGIIGIVTLISVPNFQAYQSRAKQKEGISLLATLYGNMRVARSQLDYYPTDFVAAGFRPEGSIPYRIQIEQFPTALTYPDVWVCDVNCFSTGRACRVRQPEAAGGCETSDPAPGAPGNWRTWTESQYAVETYNIPADAGTFDPVGRLGAGPICIPDVSGEVFTACGYANFGGNDFSILQIDQGKNLRIIRDGTRY